MGSNLGISWRIRVQGISRNSFTMVSLETGAVQKYDYVRRSRPVRWTNDCCGAAVRVNSLLVISLMLHGAVSGRLIGACCGTLLQPHPVTILTVPSSCDPPARCSAGCARCALSSNTSLSATSLYKSGTRLWHGTALCRCPFILVRHVHALQ